MIKLIGVSKVYYADFGIILKYIICLQTRYYAEHV